MLEHRIENAIREIPDFPKAGINFKDITSLLLDHELSADIINAFIDNLEDIEVDAVVGIESRGFLFGFLLAQRMKVPFIPIRKSGKLPGEKISYRYDLEYGSAEVEIHQKDVQVGWNVLIHDDLLATGGTAAAAAELIKTLDARVSAFAFTLVLDSLDGKSKLKQYSDNIIGLKTY